MGTADLFRHSAHGRALADLRLVTIGDGPGTGGRLLQLRTPAGLAADIALDRGEIVLRDRVRNAGFRPSRHALLYNCNVGFPVLGADARLTGADWSLRDRLDAGDAVPQDDHVEIVDSAPSPAGGRIGIAGAGVSLDLAFDPAALPVTALWRAYQSGTFALGLEPQTDLSDPASATLAPGGTRDYALTITLADAAPEAAAT